MNQCRRRVEVAVSVKEEQEQGRNKYHIKREEKIWYDTIKRRIDRYGRRGGGKRTRPRTTPSKAYDGAFNT